MKALILAGGHATRLWPITKNRAKPLLPLAGKPILSHILDELESMDHVDRIYVTTNKKFEDEFRRFLGRRSEKNELIIEDQESEDEKYGALGGIINVIKNKGIDDYIVIGGDNYYSFSIEDFILFSKKKNSITNACYELDNMEEAKNYGIVELGDDKTIEGFQEKPENPGSKTASTACYFFPEQSMEVFNRYVEYWEGKVPRSQYLDSPGRLLQWLVERYTCHAYPFTGKWMDIGTREGYLRANKQLEKDNRIEGSIRDSEIGDNVTLMEGSEVENSEIENCIVMEKSKIKDCIVKNALVGRNTTIENKDLRNGIVKSTD